MSEQNKAIVRRVYEDVQDAQKLEVITELFAPDVLVHDPFMGDVQGIDAYRQLTALFANSFPGHKTDLQTFVAEGDYVTILHTHHATHSSDFMGVPPTGITAHVRGLELYRIVGGKIVEFWRHDDDAGLLRQLGALEQPA
ncbi:MAG: ester cyclase [Anaerolineae bacterium]